MLSTINDVRRAYTQLEVAEVGMALWSVYFAARKLILFSDRLTKPQESLAVAAVEAQLSAAGIPRVPSPRKARDEE